MPPKLTLEKNRIYPITNADKKGHEHWGDANHPTDNRLNLPAPFRLLIAGEPNCGKSTLCDNIVCAEFPHWDKIFICHADIYKRRAFGFDMTDEELMYDEDDEKGRVNEYEGLYYTALRTIPPQSWVLKEKPRKDGTFSKKLLIIDDVSIKGHVRRNEEREADLDKLFSVCSTHRNLSIIIIFQNIYAQGIPSIYRYCDAFAIFKPRDKNVRMYMARNLGIEKRKMKQLFSLCKSRHDFIGIDETDQARHPYRVRLNMITPIEEESDDDE